jgi:hypothetical protein
MIESKEFPARKTGRPSWFAHPPQLEFDCRKAVSAPTLQEILQAAKALSPGQIFVVRSGSEPALLSRVLANRGFNHWPEDDGEGGHRAYFLKVTW